MGYYTHKTTKKAIDKKLEDINSLQATLGTDSTKSEKREVKREQNLIYKEIEALDAEFFKSVYLDVKE